MAVLLAGFLGLPLMVFADPPDTGTPAVGEEPDVKEILQQADDATKAVKAVMYEGELYGVGALENRVAHIKGTLKVKPGKRSVMGAVLGIPSSNQLMRFEGTVVEPGSTDEIPLIVATDGKQAYRIDERDKVFAHGEMPQASALLGAATAIYMREYLFPTPFSDELGGKEARYEGTEDVGGVECDVVFVVYQNNSESRWYFGKKDHLPHRVDRIVKANLMAEKKSEKGSESREGENAYVVAIKSLDTSPTFKPEEFRLEAPPGYESREYKSSGDDNAPLLEVGCDAPNWELSTPDGKTVSLNSLRGNVVVMDFWATWCGPCKMAMPGVQKLHEQFKNKPVKVFGIDTWERGGDPVEYMKTKGYDYGLLLKGDKVADAYKVSGLPTFYVIGPDGKILYASKGFEEKREAEIARIIKEHIKAR